MSVIIYVFLREERIPSAAEVQRAVEAHELPLVFDRDFDLKSVVGFTPILLAGEQSGVEMYVEETAGVLGPVAGRNLARRTCLALRFGSRMAECAVALGCAYVLAAAFDAVVMYEDASVPTQEELLAETRSAIAEATKG